MTGLEVEIDRSDMDRYLAAGKERIGRLIDDVAEAVSETVGAEAGSASRRLNVPWPIEPAGEDRRVYAPEFFAHFLARGTRDHGPRRADRLVFQVDGAWVSARHVAGVRANPFGERAVTSTEQRLDELVTAAIEEVE